LTLNTITSRILSIRHIGLNISNQNSAKPMHLKIVDRLNLREQEAPSAAENEDENFKELCDEIRGMQVEINHLRSENAILRAGMNHGN